MKGFKYETHLHTRETSPCGHVSAKDIPAMYREAGYEGIAVTDHYGPYFFELRKSLSWEQCIKEFLLGYYTVANEALKIGMPVILGMEIKFDDSNNEYLVYGFDEHFLFKYPKLYKKGIKAFRKLADKNNLFIAQAHPFRNGMTREKVSFIDGAEVYNGNPRHNSRNDMAMEFANKNKLIKLSGSDFHQIEDLGRGGIVIDEFIDSSEDFAAYLKNKNNNIVLLGGK